MKPSCLAAIALVVITSPEVRAQEADFACPERGCKLVAASERVSSVINNCGQGISFQVGGVSYSPNDNRCPEWIEFTPTHTEADYQTVAPNKYTDNGNPFDVTKQNYHCTGMGCGILWMEGCCVPNGGPTIVNSLPNCIALNCFTPL